MAAHQSVLLKQKEGNPLLAHAISCGLDGVNGFLVDVEAFLSNGLISYDLVGLPSAAVKESRDRIRAAMLVSGYAWPIKRVTVNLSPGDIRKEGTSFELAIAIAIMAAERPAAFTGLDQTMLLGELSLEGKLVPVRGALGMVILAAEKGIPDVILPPGNVKEVACISGVNVYPAETLAQVLGHLSGEQRLARQEVIAYHQLLKSSHAHNDLKHVKGQTIARKALEVAAAGGHNLLMVGIPGSGKTMLARCMPGILPPLSYEEALETTLIHSAAGELGENQGLLTHRPFRSPHHNISMPAMIGGGAKARPGEASLAHNGVLFLDELPEFPRQTLEALRQPLEDGAVHITRVSSQAQYPSRCMLLAGMNPCPCGNHGSRVRNCHCSSAEIRRYMGKVSGPLLDRIDMQVEMDAVSVDEIQGASLQEDSATVQARVNKARQRQQKRYHKEPYHCNAQLPQEGIETYCTLEVAAKKLLLQAVDRFHISMRAYARIHKVAKTLADLADREVINAQDIAQAIQFRNIDGQFWR